MSDNITGKQERVLKQIVCLELLNCLFEFAVEGAPFCLSPTLSFRKRNVNLWAAAISMNAGKTYVPAWCMYLIQSDNF